MNDTHDGDTIVAETPVVVRRRAGLAALIGAAASSVAIAYLWRASHTMTPLDWSLCAVMALVAGYYLTSLVDARTPLAVADVLGVRIRLGDEWRGLPWDAIKQVAVHPRRGVLRDGRIVFTPHGLARAIEGLEGKAKRHAALNQKMYGAVLAVPVGVTTRISSSGDNSVVDHIAALSLGRAEVIEVAKEPKPERKKEPKPERKSARKPKRGRVKTAAEVAPEVARADAPEDAPAPESTVGAEAAAAVEPDEVPRHTDEGSDGSVSMVDPIGTRESTERPPRRGMLGRITTILSRVGKRRRSKVAGEVADVPLDPSARADDQPASDEDLAAGGSVPPRETRRAVRAEVTRDLTATLGNASLHEGNPGSVDLAFEHAALDATDRVRPISQLGDPVEPLIMDAFVTEPAYDPVIGPQLTAARTRLGLSVDQLADRTRIRPHVIESIEVDDFDPCGGDFYARGHLRTLARVIGKDPAPLLTAFEERYATAPINARRVFEAELATGLRGSMRSTVGRPSWGLLIGVVLSLILVWGVVRFFSAEPAKLVQNPAPVLNGSAGLRSDPKAGDAAPPAKPMPVTLVAAHAGSRLVVRNGNGRIVFSGELLLGQRKKLEAAPPVRVRATDAGAIEVSVRGRGKGVVGQLGKSGNRVFR